MKMALNIWKNYCRIEYTGNKTLLKEAQPFAFYHASERRRQAAAFLEDVESDYRLRDKISIANSDDELVKIAEKAGYRVSSEDIWLYQDRTFKRKAGIRGWYSN